MAGNWLKNAVAELYFVFSFFLGQVCYMDECVILKKKKKITHKTYQFSPHTSLLSIELYLYWADTKIELNALYKVEGFSKECGENITFSPQNTHKYT